MLLVAQSGDKGASSLGLLTLGTPKWSSFGFTKQFQKVCSPKFASNILHSPGPIPHTPLDRGSVLRRPLFVRAQVTHNIPQMCPTARWSWPGRTGAERTTILYPAAWACAPGATYRRALR